jgi:signal transduction histidine kinase
MAWILLLPLLVQAMFVWGRWGVAAMAAVVLALPTLHVAHLGGAAAALEVGFGVGAGIVFVLLFSAATLRESRARRESERLGADLAAANERLAELARNAEELATSRERNRLAREIHDSVGHSLTVAHVQLEAAAALLERDPREARQPLEQAAASVRHGLAELRRSVAALRAAPLAGGLEAALHDLCAEAAAGGPAAELRVLGAPRPLAAASALALYRVAQEGLTNARKHAAASRVEVALDYRAGEVALTVADDGRGPLPDARGGFGLLGLAERLAPLGGVVAAGARPAGGFELRAQVPA